MKTLVIGATERKGKYANTAMQMLVNAGHEVLGIGQRSGQFGEIQIVTEKFPFENVDTVTLYIGPDKQAAYFDYLTKVLKPKRIIFNPGTENEDFEVRLEDAGIRVERACTLVLLSTGQF